MKYALCCVAFLSLAQTVSAQPSKDMSALADVGLPLDVQPRLSSHHGEVEWLGNIVESMGSEKTGHVLDELFANPNH